LVLVREPIALVELIQAESLRREHRSAEEVRLPPEKVSRHPVTSMQETQSQPPEPSLQEAVSTGPPIPFEEELLVEGALLSLAG
jgi:hypothetical protein